jgi:hypothetical protein
MKVTALDRGLFDVTSERDETVSYVVDPKAITCTCKDWAARRCGKEMADPARCCKHLRAVEEHLADSLAAKAAALTDEQLAFFAARYAGQPAGTACLTEMACRLAAAKAAAARPVIGTSRKLSGPVNDAEAAAAWATY